MLLVVACCCLLIQPSTRSWSLLWLHRHDGHRAIHRKSFRHWEDLTRRDEMVRHRLNKRNSKRRRWLKWWLRVCCCFMLFLEALLLMNIPFLLRRLAPAISSRRNPWHPVLVGCSLRCFRDLGKTTQSMKSLALFSSCWTCLNFVIISTFTCLTGGSCAGDRCGQLSQNNGLQLRRMRLLASPVCIVILHLFSSGHANTTAQTSLQLLASNRNDQRQTSQRLPSTLQNRHEPGIRMREVKTWLCSFFLALLIAFALFSDVCESSGHSNDCLQFDGGQRHRWSWCDCWCRSPRWKCECSWLARNQLEHEFVVETQ